MSLLWTVDISLTANALKKLPKYTISQAFGIELPPADSTAHHQLRVLPSTGHVLAVKKWGAIRDLRV